MKAYRVVIGLHVDSETPEAAYARAFEFVRFLLERRVAGHPQLVDVLPVIGPRPATQVYEAPQVSAGVGD